jgi:HPt (histidine-containing phosphotransfer) domain-containing protein
VDGKPPEPLDNAVLARLEADVGRILLPSLIGSFVADARTHGLRLSRAVADADLTRIAMEATALADAAATYGAQHLHHCADQLAVAARAGDPARTQALAASITPLTDEAVEALMSRFAG